MTALGRHILVEFMGCSSEILNDVSIIEKGMLEAARDAGATVIQSTFHHFSPYGVSGVVVIQESHLAIHTWPEYQYAAVDLFSCGDTVDPWISFDHLKKVFQSQNHSAIEMYRGSLSLLNRVEFRRDKGRTEEVLSQSKLEIQRNLWITDRDMNQALSLRYTGDIFFQEKSHFQKVRVLESYAYGKMLTIDNTIMCAERDEFHYHEMLVHPATQAHGDVKDVLVIGGGDGGTVRELFKYDAIEKVTLVEIDETVVRASKQWLPHLSSELSNPKLDLRIEDGIRYVEKIQPEAFDMIIVDGADPVGPAKGLFTEAFYKNCMKGLKPRGMIVAQGESPLFHEKTFVELNECLKKIFGKTAVHTLLFFAPTYPSGLWSVQMALKDDPLRVRGFDKARAKAFAQSKALRYYNEEIHEAAFKLPTFVREMLGEI